MDILVGPCGKSDIGEVMLFFGEHWNKRHIIATNKEFVDWQFYNKKNDNYNIIIARDNVNNKIAGMYAYVTNCHFDSSIREKDKFIWFTNWLVAENYRNKGIGHMLYNGLVAYEKTDRIGSAGTNDFTARIFSKMNYTVGAYEHYFLVNREKPDYKIIANYIKNQGSFKKSSKVLTGISDIYEFTGYNEIKPLKTNEFIKRKYSNNPFYKYFLYGIKDESGISGVIVFRLVNYGNINVIRVVEFSGRTTGLSNLYYQFQNLLKEYDAEYLDFYCYGIDGDTLKSSGFELNEGQHGLIVPNYFEPYFKENVTIEFVYNTKHFDKIHFFKGDGDRDNPRVLKK